MSEDINAAIVQALYREVLGALYPDAVVRRDCAFCHRERSPRDDNHDPDCPYWVFFGGVS